MYACEPNPIHLRSPLLEVAISAATTFRMDQQPPPPPTTPTSHSSPTDELVRGVRQRRKQSDPIACPVCGVTVRPSDIEQHYAIEIERLHKLYISDVGHRRAAAPAAAAAAAAAATGSNAKLTSSGRRKTDHQPPHHHNHHHHHSHHASTSASSGASTFSTASTTINNPPASTSADGGNGNGVAGSSTNASAEVATTSTAAAANGVPLDSKECWSTYQRIRNNRQSRLKTKSRKRKSDDPVCPVCNESIVDDINMHVEMCLRRNDSRSGQPQNGRTKHGATTASAAAGTSSSAGHPPTFDEDEDVDAEGDDMDDDDDDDVDVESAEPFAEYEWAGQTRIRASSLLQGGYAAAGVGTTLQTSTTAAGDEDEDLNVDVDDSHVFGEAQYGERDVIIPSAPTDQEQTDNAYLRKLVAGEAIAATPVRNEDDDAAVATTSASAATEAASADVQHGVGEPSTADGFVIESLKARLREYETQQRLQNKCKCLICMDEFRVPVVSICCWHVHCEDCWLRTLGHKKLCPQCNMITSPSDLRRIYM